MILAMNLLGWLTLVLGFAGVFSMSVPKWMGLVVMAMGGLSMFASWSHSRARPFEPLVASLGLLAIALVATFFSDARGWFPALAMVASVAHLAAAAEGGYLTMRAKDPAHAHALANRAFFWRRYGGRRTV